MADSMRLAYFTHIQALTLAPGVQHEDYSFRVREVFEEDVRNGSSHPQGFGMMKVEPEENSLAIVLFSKCAKPGLEIDAEGWRPSGPLHSEAISASEIFIDLEFNIIPDGYYSLMVLHFQSGSCSSDFQDQLMTCAQAFSDHLSSIYSDVVTPKSFEVCWFYGTAKFKDPDQKPQGILVLSSWTDENSTNHFKNESSDWKEFLQRLRELQIFTETEYHGIMVSVPESKDSNDGLQRLSDEIEVKDKEEEQEDGNGDGDDFEEQLNRLSADVRRMRGIAEEIAKEMANAGPCDGCIPYDVTSFETRTEVEDAGKLTGIRKIIRKIV